MKRWTVLACALLALLVWSSTALAAGVKSKVSLDFYRATVSNKVYHRMLDKQLDVAASKTTAKGVRLDLRLDQGTGACSPREEHFRHLLRNSKGQTARQAAAAQMSSGYNVWRDYDGPDGFAPACTRPRKENPQLVKLEVIGHTGQGREILALKLTQGARGSPTAAVRRSLYSATQHAREWIATEVDRRLMHYYIDEWRANDKADQGPAEDDASCGSSSSPTRTATSTRSTTNGLWRKNLRDNNGDGQITRSATASTRTATSPSTGTTTRRAPRPIRRATPTAARRRRPSPRRRRCKGLLDRINFEFQVNYHSFGPVAALPAGLADRHADRRRPDLLRPVGQPRQPGDPRLPPGPLSDVLYVTNGETTDYAHARRGTISLDARAERGLPGLRVRLPGRRGARAGGVRAQPAVRHRRGATRRRDPDDPVSHLGITTKPFYLKSDDPYKAAFPRRTSRSATPTATRSRSQVLAKRSLGAVTRQVPDQRRRGADRPDRRSGTAARSTTRRRAATTTSCAAMVTGHQPRRHRRGLVRGRRPEERLVHLPGRQRVDATAC